MDRLLRVMLDTNILIKFAFIYNKIDKGAKIPKNFKNFKDLLDKFISTQLINVMSDWNKLELRDVLMKLKLAEIFFMSGFSVDEFRDAKEEKIELSQEDINSVNQIVFDIWKFCERNTKKMSSRRIEKLTKKGYSSYDIILIYQAELNNCDLFVTNDKPLYSSEELKQEFKIEICNANQFKAKLNSNEDF